MVQGCGRAAPQLRECCSFRDGEEVAEEFTEEGAGLRRPDLMTGKGEGVYRSVSMSKLILAKHISDVMIVSRNGECSRLTLFVLTDTMYTPLKFNISPSLYSFLCL